jgi:hypothetical protein
MQCRDGGGAHGGHELLEPWSVEKPDPGPAALAFEVIEQASRAATPKKGSRIRR